MSLSECVSGLPHAPGVYIFHGDGGLPLYIGKSIDIRARVLSHLRQADEARMLSLTRRIEALETAGEIGALLLESRLIKTLSPLFNQRLRRLKTLCSLRPTQHDMNVALKRYRSKQKRVNLELEKQQHLNMLRGN